MYNIEKTSKIFLEYYKQLDNIDITQKHFDIWIESLPNDLRKCFLDKGLDECRGVLNFKRFILELYDFGLNEFMKEHLTKEEYEYYKDLNKN